MVKKIFFVLISGAMLFSACAPQSVEPVETPAPVVETEQEDETDRMPCTTIYDYPTSAETDHYQGIVDQLPPLNEDDWVRGNPDAPITIFEYADFQCPACVSFSQLTSFLYENFPNSIKQVFRHLPLYTIHDKAYISGMAAEAAGAQDKFWEMHDFLYLSQNYWTTLTEQEFIDWILDIAAEFELNVNQFETDLLDPEKRAWLEEETQAHFALGLNYTPTVVVNGRIYRENKPNLFGLVGIHEFGGYQQCPEWVIDPEGTYLARLDTSAGVIDIELYPDVAPIAVNSFIFLAQNGWYDDVAFHRVIPGFVAQAGDPSGLGIIGPGYTFINETNNDLSFDRKGLFAMANAGVDTNGSQFFITLAPAENLDGGYTIFGQVTEESMDNLEQITIRDPQTATDFDDATIIYGIEIIEN